MSRGRKRRYKAQGTRCPSPCNPTTCGAPTTRASSCSPIGATAIPLTITDFASRYLLSCEAWATTQERYAFSVFERVFKEFGLPKAIRTDNGVPFASAHALFGLSKLSVWWLRLGIQIERIKPGHPQQNGRHERMHLTLKKEATKPAARNFLQQQARFDDFIDCYNNERPHQALGMRYPAELYRPSARPYRGLADLDYPFHDRTVTVTHCGGSAWGVARSGGESGIRTHGTRFPYTRFPSVLLKPLGHLSAGCGLYSPK